MNEAFMLAAKLVLESRR